ncbi:MAG: tetraacyldisaccharide 4'-kinase [Saprospiraceae bacterium]|nr:tetraacyldisaccharide 4'-kinase [Saprospiraceae bacterium]
MIYGLFVSLYQAQYISGITKSFSFNIPVITIGNLSVGGTGKSPHVEFLIRHLKDFIHPAVLSRGYRRKTYGHIDVSINQNSHEVGDEPLQMKLKFPDIAIAVNKNRSIGIPRLIKDHPETQVIILDDAYQHLAVKPYLNILLTEYTNPFSKDYLLPSGRLREWRFGHQRAQIVVVTKCPHEPDEAEKNKWRNELKLKADQKLFFSRISYGTPYNIFKKDNEYILTESSQVILVSAIAQSDYLNDYVFPRVGSLTDYSYEDHHYFSSDEILKMINKYKSIQHHNKILLTTEKDATRLSLFRQFFDEHKIPVFAIPITVEFYEQDLFINTIKNYLLEFKA